VRNHQEQAAMKNCFRGDIKYEFGAFEGGGI
jgi:hypothetical protein